MADRTGFLGLVDMAGVLLDGIDPGPPRSRSRAAAQVAPEQRGLPVGAVTQTIQPARAPARKPTLALTEPPASGPVPRVIEAIDSETGETTWVVIHGSARAECSSPQMAEQIRSALAR